MEWTKQKPIVPGHYWAWERFVSPPPGCPLGRVQLVHVWGIDLHPQTRHGYEDCDGTFNSGGSWIDRYLLWQGPLIGNQPKEPTLQEIGNALS